MIIVCALSEAVKSINFKAELFIGIENSLTNNLIVLFMVYRVFDELWLGVDLPLEFVLGGLLLVQ